MRAALLAAAAVAAVAVAAAALPGAALADRAAGDSAEGAAGAAEASFASPAQVGGPFVAGGATWLFVVFEPGAGAATVAWEQATSTSSTRHADAAVDARPVVAGSGVPAPPLRESVKLDPGALEADFAVQVPGHLLVEAESIEVRVPRAGLEASLLVPTNPSMGYNVPTGAYDNFLDRQQPRDGVAVVVAATDPTPAPAPGDTASAGTSWSVHATGVRYVQWAGAQVTCLPSMQDCPGGGGEAAYADTGSSLYMGSQSLEELWTRGGELRLEAAGGRFAFGAQSLRIASEGWMRLPLAEVEGGCKRCSEEGTLTLAGNASLEAVRAGGGGRLAASVHAAGASVHLDERAAPGLLGSPWGAAAGAGAAAVAAWLLWKLGLWLFSAQPFDSPRRRAVYEHILANPGITYRGLAEGLGMFNAALSRHLAVLQRSGLVVERPLGNTKRFFENHGRFDADWHQVSVLRDGRMRELADVVRGLAPCDQSAIIAAMQARGWRRSTVRHRLRQLERAGLVRADRAAKRHAYVVPPAPPARPAAPALPSTAPSPRGLRSA